MTAYAYFIFKHHSLRKTLLYKYLQKKYNKNKKKFCHVQKKYYFCTRFREI